MSIKPLSEKLRTLRKNSEFKQQEIADLLNCSRSTYTYYETGKTSPSIPVLKTLARIYNIPLLDLLDDEEHPRPLHDSGVRPYKGPEPFDQIKYIYDLSPEERQLIGLFRSCSTEDQNKISTLCKNYHKNEQN